MRLCNFNITFEIDVWHFFALADIELTAAKLIPIELSLGVFEFEGIFEWRNIQRNDRRLIRENHIN